LARSGPHSRDYHLLLDEQGEQLLAMTDELAERPKDRRHDTALSWSHQSDHMLVELRDDNKQLAAHLRETHMLCDEQGNVASASLLETWIDETERRTWFLHEASRKG
jgi:starvation-inducible DNA-binding protein